MYIPAHFAAGPGAVRDLLTAPAPANLVTTTAHGMLATLLPLAAWYASKAEHGRVVPTWNYSTAHVYARRPTRAPGAAPGPGTVGRPGPRCRAPTVRRWRS